MEAGVAALEALSAAERARRERAGTYVETRSTGTGTLALWLAIAGRLTEARAMGRRTCAARPSAMRGGIVRAPYVDAFCGLARPVCRAAAAGEGAGDVRRRRARATMRWAYCHQAVYHPPDASCINVIVPYDTDRSRNGAA